MTAGCEPRPASPRGQGSCSFAVLHSPPPGSPTAGNKYTELGVQESPGCAPCSTPDALYDLGADLWSPQASSLNGKAGHGAQSLGVSPAPALRVSTTLVVRPRQKSPCRGVSVQEQCDMRLNSCVAQGQSSRLPKKPGHVPTHSWHLVRALGNCHQGLRDGVSPAWCWFSVA